MPERIKIVVWDSIGNTLLGVRPWSSWDASIREQLLAEDPAGELHAPSFRDLFVGYDVELVWLNSAASPYVPFGQLYADYQGSLRFTRSLPEIAAEVVDADFLVLHKERLPAEMLDRATRLRLIQHLGQDARGVPIEAARAKGIPIAATPLVNYLTVAEHVWALILNWAKRLPTIRARMRDRSYVESWHLMPGTRYLGDLTLGILGMGEIARPIARVAQAFGMPALYWDVERFPDLEARHGLTFVPWEELFRRSDVVTVQLALNDRTLGIIGERELGLMKPSALFVNTARGKLVDQAALTRALAEDKIGAIALDVFEVEPLPIDDPLVDLHDRLAERATLTPHCAWQSPWTWVRDSRELWDNVLRSLRGESIRHLVG